MFKNEKAVIKLYWNKLIIVVYGDQSVLKQHEN